MTEFLSGDRVRATRSRLIQPAMIQRAADHGLARLACEAAIPDAEDHDHDTCVRDDVSYAADLLWRLSEAIARGDADDALEWLTRCLDAVEEPQPATQTRR